MTNGTTAVAIDVFYRDTLGSLIKSGQINPKSKTLVVCAGDLDFQTLRRLGFTDVVMSNMDKRIRAASYTPYEWDFQDVEALTFHDGAFEQVIEHNGLHHCASPHRGLTEMYRVASGAVVVIEPRDSLCVRTACRLGLSTKYEVDAVIDNGRTFGGVRNSAVPNFVYRWTEREVKKTIATFDPTGPVNIRFFHGVALPRLPDRDAGKLVRRVIGQALKVPAWCVERLAPTQGNRFAFWVGKPLQRHAWLSTEGDRLREGWLTAV